MCTVRKRSYQVDAKKLVLQLKSSSARWCDPRCMQVTRVHCPNGGPSLRDAVLSLHAQPGRIMQQVVNADCGNAVAANRASTTCENT